jgi:hypothetical protein
MKNPFRRETVRSHLSPSKIIERLRGQSIPYESVINWDAPMEGYKTFVKESLVGDKEVVAKIQGNQFELMPIGIWPVKGQTATASMGSLYGTIYLDEAGSRVELRYRMPLPWTIFVSVFFLAACLFSLIFTGILFLLPPPESDRLALIAFIFGLPTFAALFAGLGVSAARRQSELLRCFANKLCEADTDVDAPPGTNPH